MAVASLGLGIHRSSFTPAMAIDGNGQKAQKELIFGLVSSQSSLRLRFFYCTDSFRLQTEDG
jgi:hypothetical protein